MEPRKRPEPRTAVRAIIISPRNEVLLIRDTNDPRASDKWLTPGEWLGKDEKPAVELRRFIREELRIDVRLQRRACDPIFDGDRRIEYIVFTARPRKDMPAPKGDIWSAGWFTADELRWHLGSIHPETRLILKAAGFLKDG